MHNVTNPYIIAGVVLLVISFLVPCTIWFIRNFTRTITRKEYYLFNKILKYSWIFGLVLFIIAIILFVIKLTGAG